MRVLFDFFINIARWACTLFHYPKFDQTNDSCLLNSLDHQRLGLADPAFGLLAKKIKQKIKQKNFGSDSERWTRFFIS